MYPSQSSSHFAPSAQSPSAVSPSVDVSTHFPPKVLGRIYTTDFGRFLPRSSQRAESALLGHINLAEHHARHDSTRLMGMTFGITLPLYLANPNAASLESPTIVTQSQPATLFLSPQIPSSSSHAQAIPSSAQVLHKSPLVSVPTLENHDLDLSGLGETILRTSNWVEVFATSPKSKKRSSAQAKLEDDSESTQSYDLLGIEASYSSLSKDEEDSLAYSPDGLSWPECSHLLSQSQGTSPFMSAPSFLAKTSLSGSMEMPGSVEPPLPFGPCSFSLGSGLGPKDSHEKKISKNSSKKRPPSSEKKKSKPTNKSLKGRTAESVVEQFLVTPTIDLTSFKGFFPRNEDNKMDWCHLAGAALSSVTEASPENLVAMPHHINTWMLCFETVAQSIVKTYADEGVRVFIKSTVWVPPSSPDLGFALHYQLRCFYSPTGYIEFDRFFNLKHDGSKFSAPRVTDKALTLSAFEKFMKYIREFQKSSFLDPLEISQRLLRRIEKEALKKAQPDEEAPSVQNSTSSWTFPIQNQDDETDLPPSSPSLFFLFPGLADQGSPLAAGQGYSTNSLTGQHFDEAADINDFHPQGKEYDPYDYMSSMYAGSFSQELLAGDCISDGEPSEKGSYVSSHGELLFSNSACLVSSTSSQEQSCSQEDREPSFSL